METRAERIASCVLITVSGELDTTTAPELDALINQESQSNPENYIFGLGDMEYISSVGLRVFLAQLKKVKAAGGKMILAELNDEVQEVFDMAGFAPLFEIHTSLAAAKAAAGI
ncbi:MAG: STAS domain-containing protein [Vulcanococcus sp.]|jgi:anti-anti-sigma factor